MISRRCSLALLLSLGVFRRAAAKMLDSKLQADGWPACDTPDKCRFFRQPVQPMANDPLLPPIPCDEHFLYDRSGFKVGEVTCPKPPVPPILWACATCNASFTRPPPMQFIDNNGISVDSSDYVPRPGEMPGFHQPPMSPKK